jgi:hypothetical protein
MGREAMNILSQFAQYYDYTYNTPTTDANPAVNAMLVGGIFLFMLVMVVISYVVYAFLLGRIFQKAGVEQWKAWVPVYNTWVLLELGGQQGFWAILALIPIVQIVALVFMYIAMYEIGLKLEKQGAFVLLAIFLPIVWLVWLAFDGSKWKGKKPVATKTVAAK